MIRIICRCVLLTTIIHCASSVDPVLKTPQGFIKGTQRRNRIGNVYYSFQNIPYAKPPLGPLRFKSPLPADKWEGIRDGTQDLPSCSQLTDGGQEDCLYLNVYTSGIANSKPVMVYIHGGSFNKGSAQERNFGPEFLLTRNIVLVVLNYRLGIFGFLTLDDPSLGIAGNAGLKDQVLALKWVQQNIMHYGGDPNNVILFGESAGAISVHLHVLSPMSRGLFHKAIIQSGSALIDSEFFEVRNNAVLVADRLGIPTNNWHSMLKSLQFASRESLSSAEISLGTTYTVFPLPIIEMPSNEPSFLSEDPLTSIRSGNYNQVPLIIGFNDADGSLYRPLMENQVMFRKNLRDWIPCNLQILKGSEEEADLIKSFNEFYFNNSGLMTDFVTGAVSLTTDFAFGYPAYRSVLEHLKTAQYPIYFYFFSAVTELNTNSRRPNSALIIPGACHADELQYLFHTYETPYNIIEGSMEDQDIKNMVNLWVNFAVTGNPTSVRSSFIWLPVFEHEFNYLHIDTTKMTAKIDPKPRSMKLWNDMYKRFFLFYDR